VATPITTPNCWLSRRVEPSQTHHPYRGEELNHSNQFSVLKSFSFEDNTAIAWEVLFGFGWWNDGPKQSSGGKSMRQVVAAREESVPAMWRAL
jgi:hypothetical protein